MNDRALHPFTAGNTAQAPPLVEVGVEPWVEIIEQPQPRGFRFRYICEGPSHGGIQGVSSRREGKTFPTIKIHNYRGPAKIRVTLVTDEQVPRPHVHELMGKNCSNGVCEVELKGDSPNMAASFPNIAIRHVTKKKVVEVLTQRILESYELNELILGGKDLAMPDSQVMQKQRAEKQAEEQSKTMQLNVVRLCFRVFLPGEGNKFTRVLNPVLSDPIYDSKSPGASALKICRMDKNAGCCIGNDEVFLLCDKVQKDDISVRFYEDNEDGTLNWEANAAFGPNDVHRQYAIVFKTPQYWNQSITQPVKVWVQLRRLSDGETSDSKTFMYYPIQLDQEEIDKKKRKRIPQFSNGFGSSNFGSFSGFQNTMMNSSLNMPMEGSPSMESNNFSNGSNVSLSHNGMPEFQPSYAHVAPPMTTPMSRQQMPLSYSQPFPNEFNYVPMDNHYGNMDMNMIPQHGQLETDSSVEAFESREAVPRGLLARDSMMEDDAVSSLDSKHISVKSQHESGYVSYGRPTSSKSLDYVMMDRTPIQESDADQAQVAPELTSTACQTLPPGPDIPRQITDKLLLALHGFSASADILWLLLPQRHLVAVQDSNGDNCIHKAIIHNQPSALEQLLNAVASIPDNTPLSQYNSLLQTPLHVAALTRQTSALKLLLKGGANVAAVDRHGETILHLAAKFDYEECLQLVLEFLREAEPKDALKVVDALNFHGYSALHLAVMRQHVGCVKLLTSAQLGSVNLPDGCSGRTALHHAVEMESLPLVGHLVIEAEADVNVQTFDGNTPLHIAVSRNMLGISALLIAVGADPDAENMEIDMRSDSEDEEYEPMMRILDGEKYSEVSGFESAAEFDLESVRYESEERLRSFMESGISSLRGDLDKLDSVARTKLSEILDSGAPGQNWQELSKRLGLAALMETFGSHSSPTKALLVNFEALDGMLEELREHLSRMGIVQAVDVLDEVGALQKSSASGL